MMKATRMFCLLFALLMTTACGTSASVTTTTVVAPYQVGGVFQQFYNQLGGAAVLGPPISPVLQDSGVSYQYTTSVLMGYDPQRGGQDSLFLSPIGVEMGLVEPQAPAPTEQDWAYVGGHVIDGPFFRMFERMGGTRIVGVPLSEAHYNPELERYEQYFTNVGFYRLADDLERDVHLLAYGVWKCDTGCAPLSTEAARVILPYKPASLFFSVVAQLGLDFTGFPLSELYVAPDGLLEQVFTNMVLAGEDDGNGQVILRPITRRLGIVAGEVEIPSPDTGMVFYELSPGKGYNVPQQYLDYLDKHGGLQISGPPVTRRFLVQGRTFRQCFLNLCLEERLSEEGPLRLRPAPLGYTYRQLPLSPRSEDAAAPGVPPTADNLEGAQSAPTPLTPTTGEDESIQLKVEVRFPALGPGQQQEISVQALRGGLPVPGLEPDLTLDYAPKESKTFFMYPTGADGRSSYQLPDENIPPGTTISFRVCIYRRDAAPLCETGQYMISGGP